MIFMDMIVERLSAIERSASRIVDHTAAEKKHLEAESRKQLQAYDAQVDRETSRKLHVLQNKLDTELSEELTRLTRDAQLSMENMERDYAAHHAALSLAILKKITAR